MGVQGLLPCLQSITQSVSLERYRGLTVAVDAMSWLHKGVFACDVKALAKSQRSEHSEKPTSSELKCINYTINKAETFQVKFGIEVILVIDGDALPSKKEENVQRREDRDKAFEKAVAAEKARDSRAARRFYAQSCSVSHKIKYELIKACKQLGIAFLVAPYEADAQMARLAHTGVVDLVVTEDSDLLVYGCPRFLCKVDFDTCQGQEIQLMRDMGENVTPSFRNWTHDMFVFMCITAGCDYSKGVPGIGIKLAHKLVRVHRTPSKIFSALRAAGRMPPDFEESFWIAFRTFRHQRVFCPSKQKIETLWPIAGSNHEAGPNVWPFLGGYIEPHVASRIADGSFHPSKKIVWNEALKSAQGSESMPTKTDNLEIHRRSSNNTSRRGASTANNVWHSLVYGQSDKDRCDHHAMRDGNKENHLQSTQTNGSKKDLYSFFPKHKNQGKEDEVEVREKLTSKGSDTRLPPVQEIFVGAESTSQSKTKYIPPAHHKDVPIHFNEYASRLVGKSFKPISRKRRKQENDGTKSSKYVQKIWELCAEEGATNDKSLLEVDIASRATAVGRTAQDDRVSGEEKESGEGTEGVSIFKKANSRVTSSDGRGYRYERQDSEDHFLVPTNELFYRGDTTGPQHEMAPNFPLVDEDPGNGSYHHSLNSCVQTYEDRPVSQSQDSYTHLHLEHQNSCPRDFMGGETAYDGTCRVGLESHAQYASANQLFESCSNESQSQQLFASRYSNVEEFNLFAEMQSSPDPGDSRVDMRPDPYSSHDYCSGDMDVFNVLKTTKKKRPEIPVFCSDDTYGEDIGSTRRCEMNESVFNVLKTTKKKSNDSSRQNYMDQLDQLDPMGEAQDGEDICGDVGREMIEPVFNLLKTTIKKKRYDSSWDQGQAERDDYGTCYGGDEFGGGGRVVVDDSGGGGSTFEDCLLNTFEAMNQL